MRHVPLVALLVALPALPVAAASDPDSTPQRVSASVSVGGRVLDSTGAPVAGARVAVTPVGGRTAVSEVTDGRGEFVVALWPGRYTITVAAEGFVEASQELRASQTTLRVPDFVLAVAGISEAVTVTAP